MFPKLRRFGFFLLIFMGSSVIAQTSDQPLIPLATARMENQGAIESLDLANGQVTVNGITYRFHPNLEVLQVAPEGLIKISPTRLSPNARIAVEQQDGLARRLYLIK
jgi:hypothetical protein